MLAAEGNTTEHKTIIITIMMLQRNSAQPAKNAVKISDKECPSIRLDA